MVDVFSLGQDTGHKKIYELMISHLENVPGLQPIHFLLYERAAYLYLRCLESEDEKVEKVYLGMYIDVMNELGRETRLYSKDETVESSLIYTVSTIIRSEIADKELSDRVVRRLREL